MPCQGASANDQRQVVRLAAGKLKARHIAELQRDFDAVVDRVQGDPQRAHVAVEQPFDFCGEQRIDAVQQTGDLARHGVIAVLRRQAACVGRRHRVVQREHEIGAVESGAGLAAALAAYLLPPEGELVGQARQQAPGVDGGLGLLPGGRSVST